MTTEDALFTIPANPPPALARLRTSALPAMTEKDILRFWKKVDTNGPTQSHMASPCWVWVRGKCTTGYGVFRLNGKTIRSHRVAWTIAQGPIPRELFICHHCDNTACCRPDHLFLGNNTDNMRDKTAKGRNNSPTGYKNGAYTKPECVLRGESQGCAKLTNAQVAEIRALYAAGGISQRQLAAKFNVHHGLIYQVVNRKIWKHIP